MAPGCDIDHDLVCGEYYKVFTEEFFQVPGIS